MSDPGTTLHAFEPGPNVPKFCRHCGQRPDYKTHGQPATPPAAPRTAAERLRAAADDAGWLRLEDALAAIEAEAAAPAGLDVEGTICLDCPAWRWDEQPGGVYGKQRHADGSWTHNDPHPWREGYIVARLQGTPAPDGER